MLRATGCGKGLVLVQEAGCVWSPAGQKGSTAEPQQKGERAGGCGGTRTRTGPALVSECFPHDWAFPQPHISQAASALRFPPAEMNMLISHSFPRSMYIHQNTAFYTANIYNFYLSEIKYEENI